MGTQHFTRRRFLASAAAALTGTAILAACQPQTVEVTKLVEKQVPVTQVVEKNVEVTKVVEKQVQVTQVVEKQVVVTATVAPRPAGPVTLRFHARLGTQADFFNKIATDFTAKNPNIKFKGEYYSNDEYWNKLDVLMAGGKVGDGYWDASIQNFYVYADMGIAAPMDEFVKQDNYDLNQFFPVALAGCTYKGKLVGLPWGVHPGRDGLYYNKTMFDAAKLDYPTNKWTYDDLLNAATKLTKPGTSYGIQFCLDYFCMVIHTRAFGGDMINQDGTKSTVLQAESQKAFQYVYDSMYKSKVAPTPQAAVEGTYQMFAANKLAMYITGIWGNSVDTFVKDHNMWAACPAPLGPSGKRGSMSEFDGLCITNSSQNKYEMWQYIKATCTKEAGIMAGQMKFAPGGRPDVWNSPELNADPHFKVYSEIMKDVMPLYVAANHRTYELGSKAKAPLDDLFYNKKTFDAGLPAVDKIIQGVLDEPSLTSA